MLPLDPGTVDLVLCDLPYFGTDLDLDAPDPGQLYALRDYDSYLAALDEASVIELGFPYEMYAKAMPRAICYGGLRDQILA